MKLVPNKFFLDDVFDDIMAPPKPHHNPMKCDVYEKDGEYNIVIDIPGYKKEDISLETTDGYLTIRAEKQTEQNEEDVDKKYYCHERHYGKIERSFYFGDMDDEKISAKMDNGTLSIKIPKIEETASKKTIEIE